jgi:hypothetical protein
MIQCRGHSSPALHRIQESWLLNLSEGVPTMQQSTEASFPRVKPSFRSSTAIPYVNRLDVELRMVLDVTVVHDRLRLNVHCAANHSGATWNTAGFLVVFI